MKRLLILLMAVIAFCNYSCRTTSKDGSSHKNDTIPKGILTFLTTRDGNFEIYSMDAEGQNVINLTNNKALDFWTSWSPDGNSIVFYSNRDGNNEIYRMDADGKNPVNLSNHPSNDFLPEWSPDGKKIAFTSDRDHKSREIYTMNANGSGVNRLTTNELFEEVPTWSMDGNKLLFSRQIKEPDDTTHAGNGEIFIMDWDGKNEKRLTYKKGYDSGAKFSPDGKKLHSTDLMRMIILNSF